MPNEPSTIEKDQDAFDAWIQQVLRPRVLAKQVRGEVFRSAMAGVEFLPEVLERQANQKEFALPIWEYLDIAASDERSRKGRQVLRRNRNLFNKIEGALGVEPEIITAIWGLETGYGIIRGDVRVIAALATLAYRGRRATYFEDELVAALRVLQLNGCSADAMVGSWAGAMGHGQFMPSAILDFAVDFDGDGKTNLCADDPTDALASIANYLKKHGWKKGQPWGFEVTLPKGFEYTASGLDQVRPSREWGDMGVRAVDGGPVPDYGPGSILLPAGAGGVALLVLRNFHAILRYNKAEAYAIGIGHLADRIAGGKPFVGRWPTEERMLLSDDVAELQFLLTRAGYDTQGVDGLRGPNTTRAIRLFQAANGITPDGYICAAILESLRHRTGDESGKAIGS